HSFKIYPDESLAYLEYKVKDADGTYIDLKEEQDTDSTSSKKKNEKVARSGVPATDEVDLPTVAELQREKKKASRSKSKTTTGNVPEKEDNTGDEPKPTKTKSKPKKKSKPAAQETIDKIDKDSEKPNTDDTN
ncbi:MAG: hypothetical protein K2K84_09830, partial [Muribaculaceae bacterium]|nr:hypothetical protein [Muribaculaceae bacterium]